MNHLEFGLVICTKGPYKGKIGYLDDEDICEGNQFGIVYFGNPSFCSSFHLVPITYLSNEITMYEIIQRKETLQQQILNEKDEKKKIYLLLESEFVNTLFYERHIQTHTMSQKGIKLFISYSSKDKGSANLLYSDLKEAGCIPWLDEWDIEGRQSIPEEIEKGINNSDFLLILLSNNSVKSNWVRAEWESTIWDENQNKEIRIIPILIEECEIPRFIKYRKYIDFRKDYITGFRDLLYSIDRLK